MTKLFNTADVSMLLHHTLVLLHHSIAKNVTDVNKHTTRVMTELFNTADVSMLLHHTLMLLHHSIHHTLV